MIVFITTARHAYTLRNLFEAERTALCGRLILMSYGEFTSWRRLPVGDYVLADVDRLDELEREQVADRLEALRAALPDRQMLNDPRASLRRPELLDTLCRAGINEFRACAIDGDLSSLRFPVFLRSAIEHDGAHSALLDDAGELATAIAGLRTSGEAPAGGWLVVEFVDVRNDEGLYEKFSAYRIGDRIVAADRSVNTQWVCKGEAGEVSPEGWDEQDRRYQRDNPHAARLMPIFERARIEYGRIDYAFRGGRLQVFEINTNPMIARPALAEPEWREAMQRKTEQFCAALLALDHGSSGSGWVSVAHAVGAERYDAGSAIRRAARRLLRASGLLHRETEMIRRLRRFTTR